MVMMIMAMVVAGMVFVVIRFLVSHLAMLGVPLLMLMEVGLAMPVAPGPLLKLHRSEVLLHHLLLPQTQVLLSYGSPWVQGQSFPCCAVRNYSSPRVISLILSDDSNIFSGP